MSHLLYSSKFMKGNMQSVKEGQVFNHWYNLTFRFFWQAFCCLSCCFLTLCQHTQFIFLQLNKLYSPSCTAPPPHYHLKIQNHLWSRSHKSFRHRKSRVQSLSAHNAARDHVLLASADVCATNTRRSEGGNKKRKPNLSSIHHDERLPCIYW